MFSKTIATSALLAFAAVAHGQGSAIVVNSCDYDVYVTNVPASISGLSEIGPLTIAPGSSYSQVYTELPSAGGWSIKLSTAADSADVLQYEYSYPGSETIFYDLSQINGDPWGGNWAFSSEGDCTPEQTAYTYPSDDLAAMQACPDTSSVTLTLCSSPAKRFARRARRSSRSAALPASA